MTQLPYADLTPAQQAQVTAQFSGDALLGSDPASYLYEIGTDGMVLCRQRAGERPSPFFCLLSAYEACILCGQPATIVAADWDLCAGCFNVLATPFPGELDELPF